MSIWVDPLVGIVVQSSTPLWWGAMNANVPPVVEAAVQLGSLSTTAAQGVVHITKGLCGVVAKARQGVVKTLGKVVPSVAVKVTHSVGGYALDLTTSALVAVEIITVATPEAIGVTDKNWLLLDDANNALSALQTWSTHTWPGSREQFTEEDAQIVLRAARVMTVASALSYAEADEAAKKLPSNLWKAYVIAKDAARAMLFKARDQPVMIVAFGGTQLPFDNDRMHSFSPVWTRDWQFLSDWIRNFDLQLVPYHGGDTNGPQVLKELLQEQIEAYSKEHGAVVQLFVTGHSQEAALAGVSLLDLLQDQQPEKVYTVKGSLVVVAPKHGSHLYEDAVADALAQYQIPFDLLANEDAIGYDPVVSVPPQDVDPHYVAPAGRLWIVRVGLKTSGPANEAETNQVINVNFKSVLRRIALNIPLRAIGGRVGYLHALRDQHHNEIRVATNKS